MSASLRMRQVFASAAIFISGLASAQFSVSDCAPANWSTTIYGSSTVAFVNGPCPLKGSVRFEIDGAGSSAEAGTSEFNGMFLRDLTNINYTTFAESGGSAGQTPYIILHVIRDNGVPEDLYFQPRYQVTLGPDGQEVPAEITPGTWQTWNTQEGNWWSSITNAALQPGETPTTITLAAYLADYPNAVIAGGDGVEGFALSAGGGTSWENFKGNVGTVDVQFASQSYSYTFSSCADDDQDDDGTTDACDCFPNDPAYAAKRVAYIDADGDGYDNGSVLLCYTTDPGAGYSATSSGPDCDDTDATITLGGGNFYRDYDGDGYGDALNSVTGCIAPAGYVNNNWDCNDYSSTTNLSNEQVMMCKDGRSSCVTVKEVTEKEKLGWTLGPCSNYTPCDEGRTLMCHNGKPTCVKNIDVQKKLDDKSGEWKMYPCDPAAITARMNRISIAPEAYTLKNYPNPLNNFTRIEYALSADSKVSLRVFDMVGREVSVLVNADQSAGTYMVDYNASKLSTGVYYYKLVATVNGIQYEQTQKMIVSH